MQCQDSVEWNPQQRPCVNFRTCVEVRKYVILICQRTSYKVIIQLYLINNLNKKKMELMFLTELGEEIMEIFVDYLLQKPSSVL